MYKEHINIKTIGVWMDHAEAKFVDPDNESSPIRTIHSSASEKQHFPGESSDGTQLGHNRATNNESHKHRKEENQVREYFEYLANQLQGYQEIFLFGPTTAAHEFNNYLLKENKLTSSKIHLEKTDYLTDPQIIKTVKEYFSVN